MEKDSTLVKDREGKVKHGGKDQAGVLMARNEKKESFKHK